MPRSGVNVSLAQANEIVWWYFVRLQLAATYRYTDRPIQPDAAFNIEGSSQTWNFYNITVGNLQQSTVSPHVVSWFEIENLDNVWSPLVFGSPGPRDKNVDIWIGQFDAATGLTLQASFLIFSGKIDSADFDGNRIRFAITPARITWDHLAGRTIDPHCSLDYKGPECQSVSSDTECLRTRAACGLKGNLAHFSGFDLMTAVGRTIQWGGVYFTPNPSLASLPTTPPPAVPPPTDFLPSDWSTSTRGDGGRPVPRVVGGR